MDSRFEAMENSLAGMDERFEKLEGLIEKTHRDLRVLNGHLMFSEQTSFLVFSILLSDSNKKTIGEIAQSGVENLESHSLDEAMVEGMRSSKRVLDKYLQAV